MTAKQFYQKKVLSIKKAAFEIRQLVIRRCFELIIKNSKS